MSQKNTKEYYVDSDAMWDAVNEYYSLPEDDPITVRLGRNLHDIAEKIGYSGCFINYPFREEMMGDAKVQMIEKLVKRKFKLWSEYAILAMKDVKITDKSDHTVTKTEVTFIKKDAKTKKMVAKEHLLSENDEIDYNTQKIRIKNNPFSYFTRIAFHRYINRIKKEEKESNTIKEYQQQVYDNFLMENPMMKNCKVGIYDDEDN